MTRESELPPTRSQTPGTAKVFPELRVTHYHAATSSSTQPSHKARSPRDGWKMSLAQWERKLTPYHKPLNPLDHVKQKTELVFLFNFQLIGHGSLPTSSRSLLRQKSPHGRGLPCPLHTKRQDAPILLPFYPPPHLAPFFAAPVTTRDIILMPLTVSSH